MIFIVVTLGTLVFGAIAAVGRHRQIDLYVLNDVELLLKLLILNQTYRYIDGSMDKEREIQEKIISIYLSIYLYIYIYIYINQSIYLSIYPGGGGGGAVGQRVRDSW